MTTETNPSATAKRRAQHNTLLRVPALKRPATPQEQAGGKKHYTIQYVDQNGILHTQDCTREVWVEVESSKMWNRVRDDFILSISMDKTVEGISPHPRELSMPGFQQEGKENSKMVVIELRENSACVVRHIPIRLPMHVVQDIVGQLEEGENLTAGQAIGRYRIHSIEKENGADVISVTVRPS